MELLSRDRYRRLSAWHVPASLSQVALHILVIAGAICCSLSAFSSPGLLSEAMNADISLPQAFAWDVVHGGDPWTNFELARVPSLLPDMLGAGLLKLTAPTAQWAVLLYGTAQFLALVYAAGWLTAVLSKRSLALGAGLFLALFSAAMLISFSLYSGFFQSLLPLEHWGPFLGSLVGAGLAARQLDEPRSWRLWMIGCLMTLVFLADKLLVVELTAPLFVSLFLMWWRENVAWKQLRAICFAGAAGLLAGRIILAGFTAAGVRVAPAPELRPGSMLLAGRSMLHAVPGFVLSHPAYVSIVYGIPLLLFCVFWLVPALSRRRGAPQAFLLWFAATAITGDLVFTTLLYVDSDSSRYLVALRVWTLIFSAALILKLPGARQWAGAPILAVVVGWLLGFGVADPARPAILQRGTAFAACFEQWHRTLGVEAGLADYWAARPLTLALNGAVQVVQITGDGHPYLWQSNRFWYQHAIADPHRPPRYSFIIMRNLEPGQIRKAYGAPDSVRTCEGTEVWFYNSPGKVYRALLGSDGA